MFGGGLGPLRALIGGLPRSVPASTLVVRHLSSDSKGGHHRAHLEAASSAKSAADAVRAQIPDDAWPQDPTEEA